MNNKQLPPLPTPKFTETIRGVPCITVTEHEYLMRAYAMQARAQVQGEPFGYIHHFVAHDDSGVIIDTTWEADGCADALPHPTQPAAWKWSHATPFYTTPQPAQAAQAEAKQPATTEPVGAREALERIASWSEHPAMLGVDYGSNGVRDYYRKIASDALTHPAPGVPDADFDLQELREIERAMDDFADCGETDVGDTLLMRAVRAGFLECTHFHVANRGALQDAIDAAMLAAK